MINYAVLKLPLPFGGPQINAYLINNDPVTLIDCGANSDDNKLALREQLGYHGLELKDIKRIIITHSHVDHLGMASEIQRVSQCQVYMHFSEQYRARDYLGFGKSLQDYCRFAGLPEDIYQELVEYNKWVAGFVGYLEEIIGLEDRHIFHFDGFELEGILTPGHTYGHICLVEKDQGLLFSGDTLLGKPAPVLEFTEPGTLNRRKTLTEFTNSINRLRALDIKRILPGHGNPIQDADAFFERISMQLQKQKNLICQSAANLKVFDPFTLVRHLNPGLTSAVQCSSALGEIIGYLDILEAEGTVWQRQSESALVYSSY